MMSYERWLSSILEVAKEAESQDFQQEAWLSGRPSTSSPIEIYNQLFDDYTYDLFYETYSKGFTVKQIPRGWSSRTNWRAMGISTRVPRRKSCFR
jgi:hypothetical protein